LQIPISIPIGPKYSGHAKAQLAQVKMVDTDTVRSKRNKGNIEYSGRQKLVTHSECEKFTQH